MRHITIATEEECSDLHALVIQCERSTINDPVESGHGDLAVDPLGPVCLEGVRPPWIGPVQACPAEALSDWDLGNLEQSALSYWGKRRRCEVVYLIYGGVWMGGVRQVASTWMPGPKGSQCNEMISAINHYSWFSYCG